MKKYVSLLLVIMTIFTLVSCSGETEESSASPAASSTSSSETTKEETKEVTKEETKVYGISEAAEANGLSITIDKVAVAEANTTLEKAKSGFEYIKVWYTFKNISDETVESPKAKALYIVYEEGPTGDDCDMASEENSQVMLEVPDRDERYMTKVDLAPGKSTSGWMIYQRQADKSEITMHYYSKFVNVPPDLVFRFTVE